MSDMSNIKVIVKGRVQGVCFRIETQKAAQRIGVFGYVENLPDGSVEAFFQAEKDKVEKMLEWCWKGAPFSRVDDVVKEPVPVQEKLKGFEIRY